VIVIPSLNTAHDIVALVTQMDVGAVVRAQQVTSAPGGKPVNLARFLGSAEVPCRLVALLDAATAAELTATLRPSVLSQLVLTKSRTRTDLQIVDRRGVLTVVNSPPTEIACADLEAAMAAVADLLEPDDILVLSGSQRPATADQLIRLAEERGARLAVDMSGADLVAGLAAAPWLAKVNADELGAAFDEQPQVAWDSARSLAPLPVTLVVTDGARGARIWPRDGDPFEAHPPPTEVVNPLGAGDAVMAGMLATMEADGDLTRAVTIGMGWAADVVSRMEIELQPDRATGLSAGVRVRGIGAPQAGGADDEA
jgi:1-phosphofructokinase